ncbi:hypothetical protein HaLaN_01989, partial [Haematococcus lacustris]
ADRDPGVHQPGPLAHQHSVRASPVRGPGSGGASAQGRVPGRAADVPRHGAPGAQPPGHLPWGQGHSNWSLPGRLTRHTAA